jgi:peptidoglycan/LPS O-acetylase OafA/YrhL
LYTSRAFLPGVNLLIASANIKPKEDSRDVASDRQESSLYFPALDSLRFFAAAAVIVEHVEQFKFIQGDANAWKTYTVGALGHNGVNLFYVLSAFLLTVLMLKEADLSGRVSVGQFYARRALRILPLYSLMVAFSFLVVPHLAAFVFTPPVQERVASTVPKLPFAFVFYLLMLQNFSFTIVPMVVGVSQAWSIATEEQFYLIWPHLINACKKHRIALLILFQLVLILLPIAVKQLFGSVLQLHGANPIINMIPRFTVRLCHQFNMMAIGAAAALIYLSGNPLFFKVIYHPIARLVVLLTIALNLAIEIWNPELVLGISFGALILSLTQANLKIPFQKATQYLGRISYGIYMYHVLVLCTVLRVVQCTPARELADVPRTALTYALVYAGAVAVSSLSYRFFESPILRCKKRFSVVSSGKSI